MKPRSPWRRALLDYVILSVLMIAALAAVCLLRSALPGPTYTRPTEILGPGLVGALSAAAFLDQGAVLEELGWRNFALPSKRVT